MSEERKRLSRSARLRKYESAYKACMTMTPSGKYQSKESSRKSKKSTEPAEQPRPSRSCRECSPSKKQESERKASSTKKAEQSKTKTRQQTAYQKFVKAQSKKAEFVSLPPTERMRAIARCWKEQSK